MASQGMMENFILVIVRIYIASGNFFEEYNFANRNCILVVFTSSPPFYSNGNVFFSGGHWRVFWDSHCFVRGYKA